MFHFFIQVNPGPLIDLLKKEDKKLEEILEQEAIISELKSNNSDLVDYFLKPEIHKQLINYITKIPSNMSGNSSSGDEPNKDNKANKYPYNSCEILANDNEKLVNYMIGLTANNMTIEEKHTIPDESNYKDYEDDDSGNMNTNSRGELISQEQNLNMLNQITTNDNSNSGSNITTYDDILSQSLTPQQSQQQLYQHQQYSSSNHPIDMLMSFVNTQSILNFTLAGYFAKVLRNLFYYKPKELTDYLYNKKPYYLEYMVEHLYSDSISEVLSILIRLDHSIYRETNEKLYTDLRIKILNKLIQNLRYWIKSPTKSLLSLKLDDDYQYQLIQNSSNILCTIIQNHHSNNNTPHLECLIKSLMNFEILDLFMESLQIINATMSTASPNTNHYLNITYLSPIFQLINAICEFFIEPSSPSSSSTSHNNHSNFAQFQSYHYNNVMSNTNSLSDSNSSSIQNPFELDEFANKIAALVPYMVKCLTDKGIPGIPTSKKADQMAIEETKEAQQENPTNSGSFYTTIIDFRFGYQTKPYGQYKIKLLELIHTFVRLNKQVVNAKLAECELLTLILKAFMKEEWNNILHNIILKILTLIIKNPSEILLMSLFESAKLLEFIMFATNETDYILNSKLKNKVRKGYLGHLVKLSNLIEDSKNNYITRIRDQNQVWCNYRQNFLKKSNEADSTKVGGFDPREVNPHFSNAFFLGGSSHFNVNIHQEDNNNNNNNQMVHNNEKNGMEIEVEPEIEEVNDEDEDEDSNEFEMNHNNNDLREIANNNNNNNNNNDDNDTNMNRYNTKGQKYSSINDDIIPNEEGASEDSLKAFDAKHTVNKPEDNEIEEIILKDDMDEKKEEIINEEIMKYDEDDDNDDNAAK